MRAAGAAHRRQRPQQIEGADGGAKPRRDLVWPCRCPAAPTTLGLSPGCERMAQSAQFAIAG